METLAHLVSESLLRNGIDASPDHRRLRWSNWLPCGDGFDAVLIPGKPGVVAFSSELGTVEASHENPMLTIYDVVETDDIGMMLGRMLLSESGRESLRGTFVRFSVIEDKLQRQSAARELRCWISEPGGPAVGFSRLPA